MANVIISEEEYNELKKDRDNWRDWFYELRYALRKDEQLDESISCVRDIPSDVELIEDLKKRAADSDCYKEMSELLKERNNELKEKLKKAKDLNVCSNRLKVLHITAENEKMYKEIQEWREKCIARGKDIDRLLSENKEKDKKISELESSRDAWSNTATARAEQVIEVTKDRDKWRKLYNSLSEACADYDKRCKEECEKKYRDEIKRLKKEIINLGFDRVTVKSMAEKNNKLNQTISDQEITIKALLITIKEMCKGE